MKIIPAINATSFNGAEKQIEQAAKFAELIHIDIVDGKFAPNKTWGSPDDLSKVRGQLPNVSFEIHLMVENPEAIVEDWLKAGAKRIIIHLESITDPVYIIETCEHYGAEVALAINPETEMEKLLAHTDEFKAFLLLAVHPGLAGQKFQHQIVSKIEFLRERAPNVKIEVDGGINPETAKLAKEAGADVLVSASYIFGSENPRKAYEQLVKS